MTYYTLLKDGTVKTYEDVYSVDKSHQELLILDTQSGKQEILLSEVVMDGDEEYWCQILELFKTIDRLTNKMVQTKLQKAMSIGYLAGLFTV